MDYGATADIRKTFVYSRQGTIDWKATRAKRMQMASDYERNRNRVGKFER